MEEKDQILPEEPIAEEIPLEEIPAVEIPLDSKSYPFVKK